MAVAREDLERGGTVFLRGHFNNGSAVPKKRKARVVEVMRGAARIKMLDDGDEKVIRFNELEVDDEFAQQREERERGRRERIAEGRDRPSSAPLATKIVLPESIIKAVSEPEPPPKPQQELVKLAPPRLVEDEDAPPPKVATPEEVTRRFKVLLQWLVDTMYEGKFGAKAKVAKELGISQATVCNVLNDKTTVSLRTAARCTESLGFGARYFTVREFVHPEQWEAQEAREPAQLTLVQAGAPPSPALQQTAAPSPAPGSGRDDFEEWLSMGRDVLAPIEAELSACLKRRGELERELASNTKTMDALMFKRTKLNEMLETLQRK